MDDESNTLIQTKLDALSAIIAVRFDALESKVSTRIELVERTMAHEDASLRQLITMTSDRVSHVEQQVDVRLSGIEGKVDSLRLDRAKLAGFAAAFGLLGTGVGATVARLLA